MSDTETSTTISDEQAQMLAQHAIHVQGGFSTPEIERARAEKDLAGGGTIDFDRMQAELTEVLLAKVADLPTATPSPALAEAVKSLDPEPEPTPAAEKPQRVDVTAVLAHVDAGEALRDRIKDLQKTLKIHEDTIKDVMGSATEGTDAKGNVVVRFPFRNRSDLDRKLVKSMLTEEEYAKAVRETTYRTLLYGES
jgi:hypothetical protein